MTNVLDFDKLDQEVRSLAAARDRVSGLKDEIADIVEQIDETDLAAQLSVLKDKLSCAKDVCGKAGKVLRLHAILFGNAGNANPHAAVSLISKAKYLEQDHEAVCVWLVEHHLSDILTYKMTNVKAFSDRIPAIEVGSSLTPSIKSDLSEYLT